MSVGTRSAHGVSEACAGGLAELGIDPDQLPDGLVVADEQGRVICFNAAAAGSPPCPPRTPSDSGWRRPFR